jgi:hypothetical protein
MVMLFEGGLKKLNTSRYPVYPVMSYSVSRTGYVVGYVVQDQEDSRKEKMGKSTEGERRRKIQQPVIHKAHVPIFVLGCHFFFCFLHSLFVMLFTFTTDWL